MNKKSIRYIYRELIVNKNVEKSEAKIKKKKGRKNDVNEGRKEEKMIK